MSEINHAVVDDDGLEDFETVEAEAERSEVQRHREAEEREEAQTRREVMARRAEAQHREGDIGDLLASMGNALSLADPPRPDAGHNAEADAEPQGLPTQSTRRVRSGPSRAIPDEEAVHPTGFYVPPVQVGALVIELDEDEEGDDDGDDDLYRPSTPVAQPARGGLGANDAQANEARSRGDVGGSAIASAHTMFTQVAPEDDDDDLYGPQPTPASTQVPQASEAHVSSFLDGLFSQFSTSVVGGTSSLASTLTINSVTSAREGPAQGDVGPDFNGHDGGIEINNGPETEVPSLQVAQLLALLGGNSSEPSNASQSNEDLLPPISTDRFVVDFDAPFGRPVSSASLAHHPSVFAQVPLDIAMDIGEDSPAMDISIDHVANDEGYDPSTPLFIHPPTSGYIPTEYYPVAIEDFGDVIAQDNMDTTVDDAFESSAPGLDMQPVFANFHTLGGDYQHSYIPPVNNIEAQYYPIDYVAIPVSPLPLCDVQDEGPGSMMGIEVEMGGEDPPVIDTQSYVHAAVTSPPSRPRLSTTFDFPRRTRKALCNDRSPECALSLALDLEWICEGFRNLRASDRPEPDLISLDPDTEVGTGTVLDFGQVDCGLCGTNIASSISPSSEPLMPPGLECSKCPKHYGEVCSIRHDSLLPSPAARPSLLEVPSNDLDAALKKIGSVNVDLPIITKPLPRRGAKSSTSKPWRQASYERPSKEKKKVSDADILRRFKGRCPAPVFKVDLPLDRALDPEPMVTIAQPVDYPAPPIPERKRSKFMVIKESIPTPRVREQPHHKHRALPITPKRLYPEPSLKGELPEVLKKPSLFKRVARLFKGLAR